MIFTGTLGEADVVVGGIDIGKQVPFQIVKQITCAAGFTCNATPPTGILGVRPQIAGDGVLYSLFSELPRNLNAGFIISLTGNPRVQLGATAANSSGFTTYSVPTAHAFGREPNLEPKCSRGNAALVLPYRDWSVHAELDLSGEWGSQ